MMKTLTAGLLALSLGLGTVTATPAHATLSDEEKVIGLLSLFLLGAAIAQNNDDKSDARRDRRDNRWRELPARCLTSVSTRRGDVRMFGERCLRRHYDHVNRLPARCEISVRGPRHMRHGYVPRCLRHAGFRLERLPN
ncbi:hypothetical protein [Salibaculum griseiflavum]|jgi:hypothetical protein|uniref:Uncharacterized protein n=1 Tax=Salibaculum griseiflavum TaxID=1914409 RepID=A0A2V1P1L8_9RHOB|nr:hypothetical protein [Salibaculum griseiflavum]PWG16429.1 hypothetical protein DFK10_11580 [Salibaculum griseiflavum]